jgi:uncharacterized Tic20 family protein
MTAWIAKVLFYMGGFLLGKIWGKVASWWKHRKENKQIDQEAKESVEPLKKAVTKDEINAGIDDALSKL